MIEFGGNAQAAADSVASGTLSGSDRYGVAIYFSSNPGSAATVNGISMTLEASGAASFFAIDYAIFSLANPATGTVQITAGTGTEPNLRFLWYTGVDSIRGAAVFASNAGSANGSVVATTVADDWLVGSIFTLTETPTAAGATTLRGTSQVDSNGARQQGGDIVATGTSTTLGFTHAADAWNVPALVLVPKATPPPPTIYRRLAHSHRFPRSH